MSDPSHRTPVQSTPVPAIEDAPTPIDTQSLKKLEALLSGFWHTPALSVAVRLRIADILASGPTSATKLAEITQSEEGALRRLLRALASIGVFAELPGDRFENTLLSRYLRRAIQNSVEPWIGLLTQEWYSKAWRSLLQSIQTGESAFKRVNGKGLFDFLDDNEEASEVFHRDMYHDTIRLEDLFAEYDFLTSEILVDVGGGYGALLIKLLTKVTHLSGILFETPAVCDKALEFINAAGLQGRCEVIKGDMFANIPRGGDVYVLKSILHDWDDATASKILKTCRQAMSERSVLLVVESLLDYETKDSIVHYVDLAMLVLTGGKERTTTEYSSLFDSAALKLTRIVRTSSPLCIMEVQCTR